MNTRHQQVIANLDSYLSNVASDRSALRTASARQAVTERLRRDQVDLIVVQLDDDAIDEVSNPTLRRALRTLKQICG